MRPWIPAFAGMSGGWGEIAGMSGGRGRAEAKIELIQRMNPAWGDLYETLQN